MVSAEIETGDEPLPLTRDPSALIFRIGDALNSHAVELDRAYRVYHASIFVAGTFSAVMTILIIATWTSLNSVTQTIFASFDIFLVGFVTYGYFAEKGFGVFGEIEWEVDRFRFVTTLELLPPKGGTPAERLWNSLKEASQAAEGLKKLSPEKVKFNSEVSGKSGKTYLFDIYVHQESRGKVMRFLSKWTLRGPLHWFYYWFLPSAHQGLHESLLTILVKRVTHEAMVTKSELEDLKEQYEDISKKLRDVPEHAIVVSVSGFSEEALDYAKGEESEVKPFADEEESCPLELIVERSDGSYEVAQYG